MSKKTNLQEQAIKLGLTGKGTIKELEASIVIAESKLGKPGPLKEALQSQPIVAPPLMLPLEHANNFINIINIVLPNDARAQTLITHFSQMITKSNPGLATESGQAPVGPPAPDNKQPAGDKK